MTTESHDYARVRLNAKQNSKGEWQQDFSVEVEGSGTYGYDTTLVNALDLHDKARAAMAKRYAPDALIEQAADDSLLHNIRQVLADEGTSPEQTLANLRAYLVNEAIENGGTRD